MVMPKTNSESHSFCSLLVPVFCDKTQMTKASWRAKKAGTQDRNLEAGSEAENPEECGLLAHSS